MLQRVSGLYGYPVNKIDSVVFNCCIALKMSRFAVTDVEVDAPSLEVHSGGVGRSSPPLAEGLGGRGGGEDVKMDYLTVSTSGVDSKSNEERNQMTVTSTVSGNLALYYEVSGSEQEGWVG
jgi:hypothetical protein